MCEKKSTNSEETTSHIAKLSELKKSIYQEIYSTEKEIIRLKKKIDQIEDILMGLCDHEWEFEDYCGMYDKPDKICRLCNSRIVRF